jgi:hypothetical protein
VSQQASSTDFTPVVRAVFDDLDMRQLAIFRRLSGARRIQMISEICRVLRKNIAASILAHDPDVSSQELQRRVAERIKMTYAH